MFYRTPNNRPQKNLIVSEEEPETKPEPVLGDWIIRSTPANNVWMSVTYGNGLFVAVAR